MQIVSDREDESDGELLTRTVFTFKPREKSSSPSPASETTPPSRQVPPEPKHLPRRKRPKIHHSFEKLIAAGTGPLSVLADEAFWLSLRDTTNPELGDEGVEEDAYLAQDAAFDFSRDESVPYFDASFPDSQNICLSSSTADSVTKIARILLSSSERGIKQRSVAAADRVPLVRYGDAERMLAEGILDEFCGEPESLHLVIRHLITLILTRNLPLHLCCAVKSLFLRVIDAYRGKAVVAERLWHTWSLSECLREMGVRDLDRVRDILGIHREILNVCSCWISKESIREVFLEAVRLSMDHSIFQAASRELREIFATIVCWLDVPRIHLLIEWMGTDTGRLLYQHHERPVRLGKLMSSSQPGPLGQLAAKIILDCVLFPTTTTTTTTGDDSRGEMSEGDDYGFIVALTMELSALPRHTLALAVVQRLQPRLALCAARMYYTFLDHEYKKESEALLAVLGSLRGAIPTNHYPVYISCKESLSKMETYLRSHLFRSRSNRGFLGKQMTLSAAVDLEERPNKT